MVTQADLAAALRAKALVEDLVSALQFAHDAINPPDRSGISLDKWNTRLKSATAEIQAALRKAQAWLDSKGAAP